MTKEELIEELRSMLSSGPPPVWGTNEDYTNGWEDAWNDLAQDIRSLLNEVETPEGG